MSDVQILMPNQAMGGLGGGSLQRWIESDRDPAVLRPVAEVDRYGYRTGRAYITVNKRNAAGRPYRGPDGKFVRENIYVNAPAILTQEDWLTIDRTISWQAKQVMQFWDILYARSPFNIPNGFGQVAIRHSIADGDAEAIISMDPIRKGERTRPLVDTGLMPLPIIQSDGSFSAREIAVSRGSGMDFDTTALRLAARKVGETVEKLALGTLGSYSYAGGTIYGLTNFPNRTTKTLTVPTGSNNATVITEVTDMVKLARDDFFNGPFVAFYSTNWIPWMSLDYSTAYPGLTLGDRLAKIPGISEWVPLDFLPTSKYHIILVQFDPDVIQGVQGMDMTTVQWEEQGGMEWCFKIMCMKLPRIRDNYLDATGIVHGSTP